MAESTQQAGFEKLLEESRELVCGQLGAALRAMLDKADGALGALITESREREAQAACQETRKVLASERNKLESGFQKAYLKEFRARNSSAGDAKGFAELDTPLSLMGNDDLEETLRFKDLATKLRRYCDEELVALDQRVGVLLGDASLAADANPFSPQAICDAYQHACHEVAADARVRGVLRRLFDDHVMDAIRAIYKAVNALLVKNGILPTIKYQAAKSTEGKRAAGAQGPRQAESRAGAREEEDGGGADPAEAGASLFAMLQNLVATNAAAAGLAVGAAPAPAPGQRTLQGAELLGSLTRIQKGDVSAIPDGLPAAAGPGTANVLRELKSSSFGAGMAPVDAATLDIVAMLFDMLFDDPKIPIALKGLIGRLQIPMLKVAIADKALFSQKTHPARVMLDAFGEVALRLPPEFGPADERFMQIEAMVHYVVDGFQDDVAIFATVEQQLRGVIAEEEARVATESRAVTEQAEQTEKLALAKGAAEDELRPRVQAHKLPGPVLEFLVQHWLRFLLLVHAKSGAESPAWKDALAVMDELIWSLEARPTPEDRRKLAALLPGLLRRLSAGLQALGAADAVRTAFFAELMKVHTEILKPKAAGAAQAPRPAAAAAAPVTVDFTAPVTVNNPYGGGAVQVTAPSRSTDPPANLEMGDWVEFRPKNSDQKTAKKLLFHTPKRTSYIFSDRNGKNMMDLSRGELVRRLRAGEAARLDEAPEEPLFDRIMNNLLGKLKAARAPKAA